MLAAYDRNIALLLKQRIQTIAPVKRLVVFGSRARGDASIESDLDIFIELPDLTPELRREISEIAWEVGFENEIVISTFVATTQAITNSPLAANPILQAIQSEGVAI